MQVGDLRVAGDLRRVRIEDRGRVDDRAADRESTLPGIFAR